MKTTQLTNEKDKALMKFLGIKAKDVKDVYDDMEYEVTVNGEERSYKVYTDDEAERAFKEY